MLRALGHWGSIYFPLHTHHFRPTINAGFPSAKHALRWGTCSLLAATVLVCGLSLHAAVSHNRRHGLRPQFGIPAVAICHQQASRRQALHENHVTMLM